jgi:hypothetical protein
MKFYYLKTTQGECVYQDDETPSCGVSDDGQLIPLGGDVLSHCEWDGRSAAVKLLAGSLPIAIPYSGWPQAALNGVDVVAFEGYPVEPAGSVESPQDVGL